MDKLTIEICATGSTLQATCLELKIRAAAETLEEALEKMREEINDAMFDIGKDLEAKSVDARSLIKQLYGGEESWKLWLEDEEYSRIAAKLEEAFVKAYPEAAYLQIPLMSIPHIFWDGVNESNDEAVNEQIYQEQLRKQELGYQGLMNEGKDSQDWIDFVQWIAPMHVFSFVLDQQEQVHQRWVDLGLPIPSFKEMLQALRSNSKKVETL